MNKSLTITPNRLEEVKTELEKSNIKGLEVPEEIKESDKFHCHLLFIDSRPNMVKLEFDHKLKPQIFSVEAFEKHKERNFAYIGKGKYVILHDGRIEQKKKQEAARGGKTEQENQGKQEQPKKEENKPEGDGNVGRGEK